MRARKALFWLIIFQMVALVATIAAIMIAEDTRLTFIALYAPRQPFIAVAVLALLLTPLLKPLLAQRVKLLAGVQLVLCLVVLFPVMGLHLGWSRTPDGKPIRLASYNVYFGKLGRPALLDEIAAIVRDVDILFIQAPYGSLPENLSERIKDRRIEAYDDFIVISRLPIRELIKPKPFTEEVRAMYAGYVVETDSGPVTIYNVHPYSPRHGLFSEEMDSNIDAREKQIDAAVEAAKAGGDPFVIIGDTNLPPLSGIGRRRLAGLTDAFEEVGFGFGYTFPAKRRWMRIDRAFGSESIRFLDFKVGPLGTSDHRPIFVSFELERR